MTLPDSLFQHTLWEEDKNPIWLGTALMLQRNLNGYKFPTKQNDRELKASAASLSRASRAKASPYASFELYVAAESLYCW